LRTGNSRATTRGMFPVAAPIDTLALFVRAGSIVPTGELVESTSPEQKIAKVLVYPGANADFTLYSDDEKTHAYEKGQNSITDDAAKKLIHDGASAWTEADAKIVVG
jgi:alpha-D-xyloside xylohydrolase